MICTVCGIEHGNEVACGGTPTPGVSNSYPIEGVSLPTPVIPSVSLDDNIGPATVDNGGPMSLQDERDSLRTKLQQAEKALAAANNKGRTACERILKQRLQAAEDEFARLQDKLDNSEQRLQQTKDVARELLGLTKRMRDGYMNLAEFHRVSGSTRLSLRDYIIDSDKLTARAQALLGSEGKAEAPLADTQPSGNK